MYGIKVWLTDDVKDWYLFRDINDGVVHVRWHIFCFV